MWNIIKILGKQDWINKIKGWINKIVPYGQFQWYFRCWLGNRSQDDERQTNRWKKL